MFRKTKDFPIKNAIVFVPKGADNTITNLIIYNHLRSNFIVLCKYLFNLYTNHSKIRLVTYYYTLELKKKYSLYYSYSYLCTYSYSILWSILGSFSEILVCYIHYVSFQENSSSRNPYNIIIIYSATRLDLTSQEFPRMLSLWNPKRWIIKGYYRELFRY